MGNVFGGSSNQTTTNQSSPPPQVLANYQGVVNRATGVANTPYTPYPGEQVAPLSNQTQAGLSNLDQYAYAAQPYLNQAGNMVNTAAGMTQGAAAPVTMDQFSGQAVGKFMNPFTKSVVEATQAQYANQNAQQAQFLNSQNIGAGAFGGDRAGLSQAILANQQQLGQAPVIAGLNQANYNQALAEFNNQQQTGLGTQEFNRQQQGQMGAQYGNLGGQYGNIGVGKQTAGTQGAGAQVQYGMVPQTEQQAIDTAGQNTWNQGQSYPFQTTGFLSNVIQGIGSQSGGQAATTSPGPSGLSQALGLGTAAAGIGANVAEGLGALGWLPYSDIRTKENVVPVGKTFDGQTIHKFNYKGDPRTQIGLVAQEVERRHPGAVYDSGLGGLKQLDYDAATKEAERGGFAEGGDVSSSGQLFNMGVGKSSPQGALAMFGVPGASAGTGGIGEQTLAQTPAGTIFRNPSSVGIPGGGPSPAEPLQGGPYQHHVTQYTPAQVGPMLRPTPGQIMQARARGGRAGFAFGGNLADMRMTDIPVTPFVDFSVPTAIAQGYGVPDPYSGIAQVEFSGATGTDIGTDANRSIVGNTALSPSVRNMSGAPAGTVYKDIDYQNPLNNFQTAGAERSLGPHWFTTGANGEHVFGGEGTAPAGTPGAINEGPLLSRPGGNLPTDTPKTETPPPPPAAPTPTPTATPAAPVAPTRGLPYDPYANVRRMIAEMDTPRGGWGGPGAGASGGAGTGSGRWTGGRSGFQGGGFTNSAGVMGQMPFAGATGYTPQGTGVTGFDSQGAGMGAGSVAKSAGGGFGDLFDGGSKSAREGFASGGTSLPAPFDPDDEDLQEGMYDRPSVHDSGPPDVMSPANMYSRQHQPWLYRQSYGEGETQGPGVFPEGHASMRPPPPGAAYPGDARNIAGRFHSSQRAPLWESRNMPPPGSEVPVDQSLPVNLRNRMNLAPSEALAGGGRIGFAEGGLSGLGMNPAAESLLQLYPFNPIQGVTPLSMGKGPPTPTEPKAQAGQSPGDMGKGAVDATKSIGSALKSLGLGQSDYAGGLDFSDIGGVPNIDDSTFAGLTDASFFGDGGIVRPNRWTGGVGANASASNGPGGFGAAGEATGVGGNMGFGGMGAPAGTSTTGTGGFGAGMGGDGGDGGGPSGPSGIGGIGASVSGHPGGMANAGVSGVSGFGGGIGSSGGVSVGGVSGGGAGGGGGGGAAAGPGPGGTGGGGGTGGSAGGAGGGGHGASVNAALAALLGQQHAGQQGPPSFSNLGVPPGLLSGVNTAVSPVAVSPLGPPTAYQRAAMMRAGYGGGSSSAQAPSGLRGFNTNPTGAEGVSVAGLFGHAPATIANPGLGSVAGAGPSSGQTGTTLGYNANVANTAQKYGVADVTGDQLSGKTSISPSQMTALVAALRGAPSPPGSRTQTFGLGGIVRPGFLLGGPGPPEPPQPAEEPEAEALAPTAEPAPAVAAINAAAAPAGTAQPFVKPTREQVIEYNRSIASKYGNNPDVVAKILGGEMGAKDPYQVGDAGSSFGPWQLHKAGINPAMNNPGMGDEYAKATGHDPNDPRYWQEQSDFAQKGMAERGLQPWATTAGKLGLGRWASRGAVPAGGALAFAGGQDQQQQQTKYQAAMDDAERTPDRKLLPPGIGDSLIAAGAAMMAGTSPHAMVNIGEGIGAGLKYYQAQKQLDRDWQKNEAQIQDWQSQARFRDQSTALSVQNMGLELYKARLGQWNVEYQGWLANGGKGELPPMPELPTMLGGASTSTKAPSAARAAPAALPAPSAEVAPGAPAAAGSKPIPVTPGAVVPRKTAGASPADVPAPAAAPVAMDRAKPPSEAPVAAGAPEGAPPPNHPFWKNVPASENPYELQRLAKLYRAGSGINPVNAKTADEYETRAHAIWDSGLAGGVQIPGVAQQKATTKYAEEIATKTGEEDAKIPEQLVGRQKLDAQLAEMQKIMLMFQPERYAEQKADIAAKIASVFGPDAVPQGALDNAESVQRLLKDQMNAVMTQVQAMGGRILVSEIETFKKAVASPNMQPGAAAAILAQMRGLMKWQDAHDDAYTTWREANPAAPKTRFEREWLKEPANSPQTFITEAKHNFPYKGQVIPPAAQREPGQAYMVQTKDGMQPRVWRVENGKGGWDAAPFQPPE